MLGSSVSSTSALPTERDFDPFRGDLDAQCAWKNFGGLSIDQAKAKFCENPLNYQEDFMWMGGKAFAYYFPVIEDYLRSATDVDDDDHEAWILSHCIQMQFDESNLSHVRHLAAQVIDLADFVRDNIRRFGADDNERKHVADAWAELVRHIRTVVES